MSTYVRGLEAKTGGKRENNTINGGYYVASAARKGMRSDQRKTIQIYCFCPDSEEYLFNVLKG